MKHLPFRLLTLLFAVLPFNRGQADFTTGQPADLLLGAPVRPVFAPSGVAVDPLTLKVFVSDWNGHRIFRYGSTQAMQSEATPEVVIGQADFHGQSPHTTATGLNNPAGITVDNSGRLWVADSGNHRVLRFDSASSLETGAAATAVFGQAGFITAISGTAENRFNTPSAVAVDQTGRLWVADSNNNRILRWDNAASLPAGALANGVLGQANFTSNAQNFGAAGLSSPQSIALEHSSGVLVRLWVADTLADRVLAHSAPATKANGAAADKILGAATFTRGDSGITRKTFYAPSGVTMEGTTLWVADTRQARLLRFLNAGSKSNGADADAVLGQFNFTESLEGTELDRLFLPSALTSILGRLWVADYGNRRLVRHEAASTKIALAPADGTLGQFIPPATSIASPQGCGIDPVSGKLFVCDDQKHRVLRYASAQALHDNAVPEAVLGQPDFATVTTGTTSAKMSFPRALTVDKLGNLWVSDNGNNRVLGFFSAATLASGAAASKVFGQPGFSSATAGTTASLIESPGSLTTEWGAGPGGTTVILRLWVTDRGNHRVLRFENPVTAANGSAAASVLGQPNFTAGTATTSAAGMSSPSGLAVESSGRLWVVDYNNQRVLRFDAAALKSNGAAANGVLLQPGFTTKTPVGYPADVCVSPAGRLFVVMSLGNRVLWFNDAATLANGSPAHGALGQPDLFSTAEGWGYHGMKNPQAATMDPITGQLWVVENNILQRYSPNFGPLQQWRFANFGTYSSSGSAANDADPDGDGLLNLVEYVMAQSPVIAGGIGSTAPIGLTYQGFDNPFLADLRLLTTYDSRIRLTIERSTDFQLWGTFTTRTGTGAWSLPPSSTVLLSGGGRTRFNFTTTFIPAFTPRYFLRLRVEELP